MGEVIDTPKDIKLARPPVVPAGARPATAEDLEALKITDEELRAWFQAAQ